MPTINYIWDDEIDAVFEETDENNVTTASYTLKPEPFGRLISEKRGVSTVYHEYDVLGSTRELTDATGYVTDTMAFEAWGKTVTSTGVSDSPFLWKGEWSYYSDSELGSYHVRSRTLSPAIARWTSSDPIPFLRYTSTYLYVHNHPVTLHDPTGLAPKCGCDVKRFAILPLPKATDSCDIQVLGAIPKHLGISFTMEADFSGCCDCCEYRQYVKWLSTYRPFIFGYSAPAFDKSPTTAAAPWRFVTFPNGEWVGDHDPVRPLHYGHRDEANWHNDIYSDVPAKGDVDLGEPVGPTKRSGCKYVGNDRPGFSIDAQAGPTATFMTRPQYAFGVVWNFRAQFIGIIIDKCRNKAADNTIGESLPFDVPFVVVDVKEWEVSCEKSLP